VDEMSQRMSEGYKKGGKLPAYQDGGSFLADVPKLSKRMSPTMSVEDMMSPESNGSTGNGWLSNLMGAFKARKPGVEGDGDPNSDEWPLVAGKAAKYALPFIGEALARRQLDKWKPVMYEPSDFMTGAVTGLHTPSTKLRYREPVGPDVQSEIAGQKFADAQSNEKRLDFANQDAMFRQQQREGVLNRTNQGTEFNATGKRYADYLNAQIRGQMVGARADSMREPFIAAQQHLATDIGSYDYLKSNKQTELYKTMISHPDQFGGVGSAQWKRAVNFINGL